jgi:predicted dienelactone hydrolase
MKLMLRIIGGLIGLILLVVIGVAVAIYATALTPSHPVGFQRLTIADPGHPPIAAAVWYPTSGKPGFVLIGTTGQRVAFDGPVLGNRLPLIVFSHGTAASALSHVDTALALAEDGFVVVAPTHTGDNFQDDRDVGKPDWLLNRERHLSRAIDMALTSWKDRGHIDPERIGVFGFSAGATTALITIGGVPDLRRIASQCAAHPEFVCKITHPVAFRDLPPQPWRSDPRIRAAVVAAPGLGFTFVPGGLAKVNVPVQLWAGAQDQTVPFATNAGLIRSSLAPPPETHVVPGAVHYSFLAPCGVIGPPQFCRDPNGFDRAAFHKAFNRSVVKFFAANLRK